MNFVLPPPPRPSLPVANKTARFPVRRIYCVGRNYSEHVREMGFDPDREVPFFFCKPPDAAVEAHESASVLLAYPSRTEDYQHEIELVVAIGKAGNDIPVDRAAEHVYGYAVGIDMTRRDLQVEARMSGRPWEAGKAFDASAPVGLIHPASTLAAPLQGAIWLRVNGVEKQRSDLGKLIWSVPEIIANLSTLFRLEPGDLVFTGTPAGVGAVAAGDVMTGGIAGLSGVEARVVAA